MNPRHAAALALVGWLMMTPPTARDGKILYNAPLADWEHERGGDTEAQCRANIENLLRGIKKAYPDTLKEEKMASGSRRQMYLHRRSAPQEKISDETPPRCRASLGRVVSDGAAASNLRELQPVLPAGPA